MMIIRFTLFFEQLPSDVSGSRTCSGTCDISGFHCSLVYITCKVSCSACLNYPACYRWNSEVTDDTDNHKDDIHRIGGIGYECGVRQHRNILFQYEGLYSCKHRTEQIRNRKPQVNTHIPREPLRECGLKAIPHGDGKGNWTENA